MGHEGTGVRDDEADSNTARRRTSARLAKVGAALAILIAAVYLTGFSVSISFSDVSCLPGSSPVPVGLLPVSQCRPTQGSGSNEPTQAVAREREFDIYLTRLGVRVLEVDLVAGIVHGPALNAFPRR